MSYEIILMLFAAGLVAGGINAIAGGSTLFTFPVLMAAGLPPTVANASNFVAVLPGNAAAIPAYARELGNNRTEAVKLLVASLSGGIIGSLLLIISTDAFFLNLVPWLILTATLFYAFGDRINHYLSGKLGKKHITTGWIGYFLLFIFSIYGGYFGAGLGIITLAVLKIMGYLDFHEANALKNLTNYGTQPDWGVFILFQWSYCVAASTGHDGRSCGWRIYQRTVCPGYIPDPSQ